MPTASSSSSLPDLPRICHDLPPTGGRIKSEPADFVVDEVPLYPCSGEGQHLVLHVEKEDRNTEDVVSWLRRAGLREIGVAGRKDRQAVTRQYISVERRRWTEEMQADAPRGIRVLSATPHGNKLKTGHLRGNRFTIRIRDARVDPAILEACVQRLSTSGMPNFFGPQRFGSRGDNAELGLAILRGRIRRPRRKALFLISALQSALFNALLTARVQEANWRSVLPGEILKKTDSGGLFHSTSPEVDQPRLDAREVVTTGPLYGADVDLAESTAGELEQRILEESGLSLNDWKQASVRSVGSRRPLILYPGELRAELESPHTVVLSFFLPKGAFATVLLREIMGDLEEHRVQEDE